MRLRPPGRAPPGGLPTPSVDAVRYPEAPRLDLVEDLHGTPVADPYRWLEDVEDPRTRAWTDAQDALTTGSLAALPLRADFAGRLERLVHAGAVGVPVHRGGRAFSTRRDPGQEHAVLRVREPDGTVRVLVDPMAVDPAGTTTLDAWSPSWEGDRLAYQLSTGGDEESRLYVLDVATGEQLDGPVDRCRYSPVAWLPGGEELFYVRRLAPDRVPAGEEQFHRRVWRHRVGADPDTDALVHGEGLDPTNYYGVRTSARRPLADRLRLRRHRAPRRRVARRPGRGRRPARAAGRRRRPDLGLGRPRRPALAAQRPRHPAPAAGRRRPGRTPPPGRRPPGATSSRSRPTASSPTSPSSTGRTAGCRCSPCTPSTRPTGSASGPPTGAGRGPR